MLTGWEEPLPSNPGVQLSTNVPGYKERAQN
jgi:hypothetical protein